MGRTKYLLFLLFGILSLFLGSGKTKAADTNVVINEVMANALGDDTDKEWVEIGNFGNESTNLLTWQLKIFNDPSATTPLKIISFNSIDLDPGNLLVIVSDASVYKPCDNCLVYNGNFTSITNSKGKITLINATDGYEHSFSWDRNVGDGVSMELVGPPSDPTYLEWLPSLVVGGTPGAKNSVSNLEKPKSPVLRSPTDFEKISFTDTLNFVWQEDSLNTKFEFVLSQSADLSDYIVDENNIENLNFNVKDLVAGKYYWQVIAFSGLQNASSEIFSFEILEPVISEAIIVNEIYPDPSSGEEWIELFNDSNEDVNLKDWILEDLKGSVHQYKITEDLVIPAYGYLKILKSGSGITLNNDQDGVRLTRPDGQILYETPIFSGGKKGWSFAKNSAGEWLWTTTLTPEALNVISMPATVEETTVTEEEEIPKNTEPIEIKTGEAGSYENYLVKIVGAVTSTSGSTFYLDDGSGKIKVYIQAATEIDKPKMYVGDIFEVTGIVNLYRDVWRILPQKQDDIKLIKAKKEDEVADEVKVKTTATKSSTSSKTTTSSTTAKARAPTVVGKVAAASNENTKIGGYNAPLWVEIVKAFTGLVVVFLVVLVFKLVKIRNSGNSKKPIGGDFGDDFT